MCDRTGGINMKDKDSRTAETVAHVAFALTDVPNDVPMDVLCWRDCRNSHHKTNKFNEPMFKSSAIDDLLVAKIIMHVCGLRVQQQPSRCKIPSNENNQPHDSALSYGRHSTRCFVCRRYAALGAQSGMTGCHYSYNSRGWPNFFERLISAE